MRKLSGYCACICEVARKHSQRVDTPLRRVSAVSDAPVIFMADNWREKEGLVCSEGAQAP